MKFFYVLKYFNRIYTYLTAYSILNIFYISCSSPQLLLLSCQSPANLPVPYQTPGTLLLLYLIQWYTCLLVSSIGMNSSIPVHIQGELCLCWRELSQISEKRCLIFLKTIKLLFKYFNKTKHKLKIRCFVNFVSRY